MIYIIIRIGIYLIVSWIALQTLNYFLVPRKDHPAIKLIMLIAMRQLLQTRFDPQDIINILIILLCFVIFISLFYKGKWIVKLSTVLILFPIMGALQYITTETGFSIWYHIFHQQMSEPHQLILENATHLLLVPLWYGIYRFVKRHLVDVTKHMTEKMWLVIDGITLSSCVGIITVIATTTDYSLTYASFPACFACIITCLGSCWLCSYIAQTITAEMELETYQYQQSYYEELEQNQEQLRKLRHDMKNHLDILGTFLRDQDIEQANSYYQSLSKEFEPATFTFCENSIVNAVLNVKYSQALHHHITCTFQIDIKETLPFDSISLCSLISNTMDNAIEAGQQIASPDKRFIQLKMRYFNGYFSYEITNAKQNVISSKHGKIKTSKPDARKHGYGLKNVNAIVDEYQGTSDISYTEDEFTVIILIPFPL